MSGTKLIRKRRQMEGACPYYLEDSRNEPADITVHIFRFLPVSKTAFISQNDQFSKKRLVRDAENFWEWKTATAQHFSLFAFYYCPLFWLGCTLLGGGSVTTLHLSFLLFRCPMNSSVSSSRPIHVKLNIFTSYFYFKTTSRQLLICLHIILHIIYLLGFTLPGGGSC